MTATQQPEQGYDPNVEGFDDDYSDTMGKATFRLVFNGFGFEWTTDVAINDLANIILELQAHDMKGANTPLLWPEDKPEAHRPVSTPPNGAAPQNGQPQQPQGRANDWDWQGNTTYAETAPPQQHPGTPQGAPRPVPTRFDPDGTPYCPYHNERMAVSKFGGWYCQKQGGPSPNNRGYCSYQYKGHNG